MEKSTSISESDVEELEARIRALESDARRFEATDGMNLVVFSGELDRVLASLNIATAAAASGTRTSVFFTFWGTTALLAPHRARGKSVVERCFGRLLPRGSGKLKLSRLHMGGIGRALLLNEMRRKGAPALEELIEMCADSGVVFRVCEMTMSIMGIRIEELRDYPNLEICGATAFVESATAGSASLFV